VNCRRSLIVTYLSPQADSSSSSHGESGVGKSATAACRSSSHSGYRSGRHGPFPALRVNGSFQRHSMNWPLNKVFFCRIEEDDS